MSRYVSRHAIERAISADPAAQAPAANLLIDEPPPLPDLLTILDAAGFEYKFSRRFRDGAPCYYATVWHPTWLALRGGYVRRVTHADAPGALIRALDAALRWQGRARHQAPPPESA
ncbi:hypothetical protein GCM10008959_25360 [Deinococcus seoulensis]|uniref:Uncharacterized protein n=1 Tax=Deinococcus seoulensis TaxID=1837379 RepID=A0ABQ2RT70_9DEIO|nr:hypothetical protein [Deinococcus seoulensis]GGR62320.1 hypothetical protein GCM10008959_25360 [Deinococcus seoulensis]